MQRWRVAYNFGCRALYNLPWRASVSSHQVQCNIPTFEAVFKKIYACFQIYAESLTMHGCMLWCTQVVYIAPYSLKTTITSYFVTECIVLYLALTSLGTSILLCTGFLGNFKYKFPYFFKTLSRHFPDLIFSAWPTQVKYRHYNL